MNEGARDANDAARHRREQDHYERVEGFLAEIRDLLRVPAPPAEEQLAAEAQRRALHALIEQCDRMRAMWIAAELRAILNMSTSSESAHG